MTELINLNELINCVHNDDQIDPRIQNELESLNTLSQLINQFELELNEKRLQVKKLLHEFGSKIDKMYKKLGSCVDKARPYYEAKKNGKKLQLETQKATLKFERACSSHLAAQEMVSLAEQVFIKKGRIFDPVWQEMIDQTTNRVNQIVMERVQSEKEHMITSKRYNEEEQLIQRLQQKLKRSIAKSRPYFELKSKLDQSLEENIQKVKSLEEKVRQAKSNYSNVLRRLENISNEIHQKRKIKSELMLLRKNENGSGLISIQSLIEEEKAHLKLDTLSIQEISQLSTVDNDSNNNDKNDKENIESDDDDDFNDCESFMSLELFDQDNQICDNSTTGSVYKSNVTLNVDNLSMDEKN